MFVVSANVFSEFTSKFTICSIYEIQQMRRFTSVVLGIY
jgi:hypothetical protein